MASTTYLYKQFQLDVVNGGGVVAIQIQLRIDVKYHFYPSGLDDFIFYFFSLNGSIDLSIFQTIKNEKKNISNFLELIFHIQFDNNNWPNLCCNFSCKMEENKN